MNPYKSITFLHVKARDIAPQDVFHWTFGSRPNGLPDHSAVTVVAVDAERGDMTVIRNDLGTQHHINLCGQVVFAGPKITAANANPALVKKVAVGWWWLGSEVNRS